MQLNCGPNTKQCLAQLVTISNVRSCPPNGLVFSVDITPKKNGRTENLANTPKDYKPK